MTCDVTRCPTPAAWEFRWQRVARTTRVAMAGVSEWGRRWHYCPRHATPHLADPTAQKRRVA